MLTGNGDRRLRVSFYESAAAWQKAIANFCDQISRKDYPVSAI
jgi:hypothetical protein